MVKKLKEQVFVSLVIYIRNHEKIIIDALDRLMNLLKGKFNKFEIVVVNDASTDDTESKIKNYIKTKNIKGITLINLSSKHGLEVSMQAGVDFSIGDFVIELDSPQLHYDEKVLYTLYEKSCEGYDIVSLEPKAKKKLSSAIFYKILNKFSDKKINLKTQIAHILTRRAVNAISTIKNRIQYRKLSHVFIGYKKTAISIKLTNKIEDSNSISEKIKISSDIIFSFTNLGIKINIYIALLFFLFSVFLGIYALYQYITYEQVIKGWTTLMLFLSFGFSGIFMILSIVNKYFSILLREVRSIPKYTIKNIEKL